MPDKWSLRGSLKRTKRSHYDPFIPLHLTRLFAGVVYLGGCSSVVLAAWRVGSAARIFAIISRAQFPIMAKTANQIHQQRQSNKSDSYKRYHIVMVFSTTPRSEVRLRPHPGHQEPRDMAAARTTTTTTTTKQQKKAIFSESDRISLRLPPGIDSVSMLPSFSSNA